MIYDIQKIIHFMNYKNYLVFNGGSYDFNLVGVRSADARVDFFDDMLYAFYRDDSIPENYKIWSYPVTTLSGSYYLQNPMNVKGTAILKAGQYRGMWKTGMHNSQFALIQAAPCIVIRDNNKDGRWDFNTGIEETGVFNIDCHRKESRGIATNVGLASAGCVVHADAERFDSEFMPMMKTAADLRGNGFTFTLINEIELLRWLVNG